MGGFPRGADTRRVAEADIVVTASGKVLKYRQGDPNALDVYVVPGEAEDA